MALARAGVATTGACGPLVRGGCGRGAVCGHAVLAAHPGGNARARVVRQRGCLVAGGFSLCVVQAGSAVKACPDSVQPSW